MEKLAQCPCGEVPEEISVISSDNGCKYALAVPDCCWDWMVEFRTIAYDLESDATKEAAIEAWDKASRSE